MEERSLFTLSGWDWVFVAIIVYILAILMIDSIKWWYHKLK